MIIFFQFQFKDYILKSSGNNQICRIYYQFLNNFDEVSQMILKFKVNILRQKKIWHLGQLAVFKSKSVHLKCKVSNDECWESLILDFWALTFEIRFFKINRPWCHVKKRRGTIVLDRNRAARNDIFRFDRILKVIRRYLRRIQMLV